MAPVESVPLDRTISIVGTLFAKDEATIAAQVEGQVEKTRVDFGDRVTEGQELALIDTTAYESLARQSAANLAKARASADNAEQNLKRIQDLQKDKIASASQLDEAEARVVVQVHRGRADLQLRTAVLLDPDRIAAGERAIQDGLGPFFAAGRRDGHFALDEAQPGDATGRVNDRRFGRPRWRSRKRQQQWQAGAKATKDSTEAHVLTEDTTLGAMIRLPW